MKHEILIYNKTEGKVPKKFICSTISGVLKFLKVKQPAALAVLIVASEEIRRLNKIWRRKSYVPDELSFGLDSHRPVCRPAAGSKFAKTKNKVLELGEIIINRDKVSNKNHLSEIIVHGLLHLLGYGHGRMKGVENKILKNL